MTPREVAVDSILSLRQRLLEATTTTTTEPSAVSGRVLADTVAAPSDDPATDRSTMDGYAIATADEPPREIRQAEVYPESEQPPMTTGEAVPVATGGRLPERADAVLKREDVTVKESTDVTVESDEDATVEGDEDTLGEDATVEHGVIRGPAVAPGTNVYERGSNVAAGEMLFERGERLLPKDAVLLDDLGVSELLVRRRWSVGVLATGTEIHADEAPDRDSHMLVGLARSWGHDATHEGSVPDDLDRVRDRLQELGRKHDVVLTSGGTSVGSRDYVVRALGGLGDLLVRGTRTRPGSSTAVARLSEAAAIALPGRPVACHAAALLFARPLLTGRSDFPGVTARAALDVALNPDGECVVPVVIVGGDGGSRRDEDESRSAPIADEPTADEPTVRPIDANADDERYTFRPSRLSSMTRATRADGFLLLEDGVEAGERVRVVPYAGVERS